MYSRHITGRQGESKAVGYLRSNGFEILAINYRTRYGEVDVVCRKGATIVFVEVKTRSRFSKGMGYEAINHQKIRKLKSAGVSYLKENPDTFQTLRIDVISIDDGQIKHFENVSL